MDGEERPAVRLLGRQASSLFTNPTPLGLQRLRESPRWHLGAGALADFLAKPGQHLAVYIDLHVRCHFKRRSESEANRRWERPRIGSAVHVDHEFRSVDVCDGLLPLEDLMLDCAL